jgi:hypothetical protein
MGREGADGVGRAGGRHGGKRVHADGARRSPFGQDSEAHDRHLNIDLVRPSICPVSRYASFE